MKDDTFDVWQLGLLAEKRGFADTWCDATRACIAPKNGRFDTLEGPDGFTGTPAECSAWLAGWEARRRYDLPFSRQGT